MNRISTSRLEQQDGKIKLGNRKIFLVKKKKFSLIILLLKVTDNTVQNHGPPHLVCLGVVNRNLRALKNLVYFPILKLWQLKKL